MMTTPSKYPPHEMAANLGVAFRRPDGRFSCQDAKHRHESSQEANDCLRSAGLFIGQQPQADGGMVGNAMAYSVTPHPFGVYLAHPDARMPARHFDGDLGFDLFCAADTFVPYQEPVIIPTGVILAFPPGVGAIVTDRSSSFLKRRLMIHHGKVDNAYREPIGIIAWSLSAEEFDRGTEDEHGNRYGFRRGQWVRQGERVAQLVFVSVHPWTPAQLPERPASIRGGYGSTGTR